MPLSEFASILASLPEADQSNLLSNNNEYSPSAIAGELRKLCYDAWMSDPAATGRIASAMRLLDAGESSRYVSAVRWWVDGILALSNGEMNDAADRLDQAFNIFNEIGKPLDAAETCISRMYALAVLGSYDEAISIGEQAREAFIEGEKPKSAGKIEHNLGNIYQRLDRYADAEEVLKSALKKFSEEEDHEKIIQIENSLALAYANQTKLGDAETLYEQSLRKAESSELHVTQAEIESNLGYLSLFQGNYSRSLNYFERSRGRYVLLGMEHQAAIAEQEVGDVYLELNLFPEARSIYQRIIPVFEKLGMQAERARALAYLARTEIALGNHAQSHRFLSESKQIYTRENNGIGQSIVGMIESKLFLLEKTAVSAIAGARLGGKSFRTAGAWPRAIEASIIEAESLMLLGEHESARKVLDAATAEAIRLDLPQSKLICLTSLGSLEMSLENFAAAESVFLDAIELVEAMRSPLPGEDFRTGFVADKLTPYFALTSINLAKGTPHTVEIAFEFTERARSRALLETLDAQNIGPQTDEPETNDLARQKTDLRRELNWLYRQTSKEMESAAIQPKYHRDEIRRREDAISELTRRIAARSSNAPFLRADPFILSDLQERIGSDNVLIEYTAINEEYIAFVVTEDGLVAVENLATEDDIRQLLSQLDLQIEKFKHPSNRYGNNESVYITRQLLAQLYTKLIKPLLGFVEDRNLVIVPFQDLNYVPFHALFDGFEYLIESREVTYSPSAAIFFQNKDKSDIEKGRAVFLGIADEKAPRIEDELKSLCAIVPNSDIFVNNHATLDSLRTHCPSAEILHLACHGKFRSDNPLFSSLKFSDGMLTVRDVYDLNLRNCRLAVLSACETGVSSVARGEELLGLIRGFLCAGAANLIISMWQVDDEISNELMIELYRSLVGGSSPARALANAQRKILKYNPHPFYWAPFFLVGRSEK